MQGRVAHESFPVSSALQDGMVGLDLISSDCLDSKGVGDSVVLSRAGAFVGFPRGCGIPRGAAGVTRAPHGFVLRNSPHGLLLLAPQPHEDQLTLQQEVWASFWYCLFH